MVYLPRLGDALICFPNATQQVSNNITSASTTSPIHIPPRWQSMLWNCSICRRLSGSGSGMSKKFTWKHGGAPTRNSRTWMSRDGGDRIKGDRIRGLKPQTHLKNICGSQIGNLFPKLACKRTHIWVATTQPFRSSSLSSIPGHPSGIFTDFEAPRIQFAGSHRIHGRKEGIFTYIFMVDFLWVFMYTLRPMDSWIVWGWLEDDVSLPF